MMSVMRGRELDPDPGLPFWNNRIIETDHVYPLFQEISGHILREFGIILEFSEHDGNDRMDS